MKRIQMVKVGNTKKLCLTQLVIIMSASMSEKLNCEKLLPRIDAIAKDLHIEWAVELCGEKEFLAVSRVSDEDIINDEILSKLEKDAIAFYDAVNKMDVLEPECPSHESGENENLKFVKELLNDMNLPLDNERHVIGAMIIDTTITPFFPELTCWGKMSYDVLKEMCQLYIKAHDHE